jgi:DNA-directed RNA polymerase specialized sigma24 family protein
VIADLSRDPDAVAAAFVAGEVWAFDEIRARLQSKLRRDIREILHDMPQFVDEVEADTWVTPLLKEVHEAASFKKLYAWLRTIAVNKALDVRRKHSRTEAVETWEDLGLRHGRRVEDPSNPIAFKADLLTALIGMRQRTLMVVVLEEIEAEDGLLIDAFERAAARLGKSTPYVKRIFYELRPLLAIRMPGWEKTA